MVFNSIPPSSLLMLDIIFCGDVRLEEPELEEKVVGERAYHRHSLRDPFAGIFFNDVKVVVSHDDPCLF